ncbi:MAG TPA: F0F1 ATP synthase subunit epsilon [Fimbriimonadales bacterium]|nr:F0F1 ATP synthase subunit epsilon [Fimbriimonadales bacterium]
MSMFQLSVVSPDRIVVDEVAESLVAPGVEGYFGILAGHEPFVSQLKIGALKFRDAGGRDQKVAVAGGFLEASGDRVIVLADAAERAEEIDIERARAALERARKRLEEKDVNIVRAQAAIERALNRLKVAGA